jgi:hypothetical protein
LHTTGTVLEAQFARRGLSTNRPVGTPLTTSPMDAFVNPIRDAIRPRAYALKNRERTNRMLMLMQLARQPPRRLRCPPGRRAAGPPGRRPTSTRAPTRTGAW